MCVLLSVCLCVSVISGISSKVRGHVFILSHGQRRQREDRARKMQHCKEKNRLSRNESNQLGSRERRGGEAGNRGSLSGKERSTVGLEISHCGLPFSPPLCSLLYLAGQISTDQIKRWRPRAAHLDHRNWHMISETFSVLGSFEFTSA